MNSKLELDNAIAFYNEIVTVVIDGPETIISIGCGTAEEAESGHLPVIHVKSGETGTMKRKFVEAAMHIKRLSVTIVHDDNPMWKVWATAVMSNVKVRGRPLLGDPS